MWLNLGLGSLLVSVTVLMHSFGLIILSHSMPRVVRWFGLHHHSVGKATAMVAVVLGIFLVHTAEVWLWAWTLIVIGALSTLEQALYFSTATFATIGTGEMMLNPAWRLLGSLEGVNGFILIGWSTAYLVAASTRFGPFRRGEHF